MSRDSKTLFKLTLSVEEAKGVFFVSSEEHKDIFIAVTSRDDIRRAVETCLRDVYGREGRQVLIYMNSLLQGPTVDAVVELR